MMMHHHAMFGYKSQIVQKTPSRQTFNEVFNLRYDLNLEHSKAISPHDTPAYDDVPPNNVW